VEKEQDFCDETNHDLESEKNTETNKSRLYEEMFNGEPDAIFVLNGEVVKKPNNIRRPFQSTSFASSDNFGMLGGKARVIAAAEVGKYFSHTKIVATSHSLNPERSKEPTLAQVMANELEHYGIPENQIVLEEKSTSTLTTIVEMIKLAKENNWVHLGIISNDYHLPRVQAMYKHIQELINDDDALKEALQFCHQNDLSISFIAAEDILPHKSTHYIELIRQVQQSQEYLKRIESEKIGLEKIEGHAYLKDMHTPEEKDPK
jgi:hypothetical protein